MEKIDWTKPVFYVDSSIIRIDASYLNELFLQTINLRMHAVEIKHPDGTRLVTVDDFGVEMDLHAGTVSWGQKIVENQATEEYLYSYILLRTVVAQDPQQFISSVPNTKEMTMFNAKCKSPYWTIQGYLKYTIIKGKIQYVQFFNEEEFKNA